MDARKYLKGHKINKIGDAGRHIQPTVLSVGSRTLSCYIASIANTFFPGPSCLWRQYYYYQNSHPWMCKVYG